VTSRGAAFCIDEPALRRAGAGARAVNGRNGRDVGKR
jgi:hypothetical protein